MTAIKEMFSSVIKRPSFLFMILMLTHTLFSFYYITQHNITYDEPHYIEYAKRWLHGKPDRIHPLDDSKSPVIAICWVPRIVRQVIHPNYSLNDYGRKDQSEGRYMMILFSFVACYYVFLWCRDLYGNKHWFLPLLLLVFDPLYLAYSSLITTDLACGAFLVALLFHFRKYLLYHHFRDFVVTAIVTGIAIVTKQTLLFVLVLLPIIFLSYKVQVKSFSQINLYKALMKSLLFIIIVFTIINLFFYFTDTFLPFGAYVFESKTLQSLQNNFSFLHQVPVPLPKAYIQSLDLIKAHAELGAGKPESTYNGVYLFGQLHLNSGFWYYYFVTFFLKTPVSILLLIGVGIIVYVIRLFSGEKFITHLFIVLPILFYWVLLSCFNNFQTGVRHLLIIYPLLYIAVGKVLHWTFYQNKKNIVVISGVVLYFFVSVFSYYPYIIPYTNEFISNKKTVYKTILDSGIDYGQSDSAVNIFISQHREFKRAASVPDTGRFIVPMGKVVDLKNWNTNPYKWYENIEPTGLYQNVLLLYKVKKSDIEKFSSSP